MLKKIFLYIWISTLLGCADHAVIYPRGTDRMLDATWVNEINTNPTVWTKDADPWFLTGKPNLIQQNIKHAPFFKAITMSTVRVPDFTNIAVAGDFQVQIVGGQAHNSIYIYGTNTAAHNISVQLTNNKLLLTQTGKVTADMQHVIVRIGIKNLRSLENFGNSLIMGRTILSDKMRILSSGAGSILLQGQMRLKILQQTGSGTITVIGAYTPSLNLSVVGNGRVNINGQVGIENIVNQGNGIIEIIGANSNNLCITAEGNSLTKIYGYVNLKQISAQHNSRVYVYWVFSKELNITTKNKAIVGLAGSTTMLNVAACDNSCFLGEYLKSRHAYVSTKNAAHANIAADQRIFATAQNQSRIIYYGPHHILSKFISHQASIITIERPKNELPNPPFRPYVTKDDVWKDIQ